MSEEQISVVAQIRAKSGKEETVKQELLALVQATRAEDGCINYDLHQSLDDNRHFIFYENWVSRKALDEHLAKPYLRAFVQKTEDLLADPIEVNILRLVSPKA